MPRNYMRSPPRLFFDMRVAAATGEIKCYGSIVVVGGKSRNAHPPAIPVPAYIRDHQKGVKMGN